MDGLLAVLFRLVKHTDVIPSLGKPRFEFDDLVEHFQCLIEPVQFTQYITQIVIGRQMFRIQPDHLLQGLNRNLRFFQIDIDIAMSKPGADKPGIEPCCFCKGPGRLFKPALLLQAKAQIVVIIRYPGIDTDCPGNQFFCFFMLSFGLGEQNPQQV